MVYLLCSDTWSTELMFTSLDLGMNGEKRYWVPGAGNVFCQPFNVWHSQGMDRETDFLRNGKGILSHGAMREGSGTKAVREAWLVSHHRGRYLRSD